MTEKHLTLLETATKEPTMSDIEWHGRLFTMAGAMSYARTVVSHT